MVWVFLVFTSFMLLFVPFIVLPFFFNGGRISYFFLWLWSYIFSLLTFIRYEYIGREHIQKGKAYIYVSNHTSFLDLPGIRMMIPGEFRPLAKKELRKIPVFGWIVDSATIVVDRTSPESRKKSMEILKKLILKGISLLIFVEGTQNRTKETLQPFKEGAFRLGIDAQVPLLPMVVIGAGPLMPPGTINLRPGKIYIIAMPEIPTEGLTLQDMSALKEKTFALMKKRIEEFRSDT